MRKSALLLSMPYALCLVLYGVSADAALRIGNTGTGRGGTYANTAVNGAEIVAQQQATQQEILATAKDSTELGLPVRVANMDMARAIASGQSYNGVQMANLNSCAAIFPNGSFAWDSANAGLQSTSGGCVADVELRLIEGTEDVVLAHARVAAGSSIDCNIDSFPAAGLMAAAGKVVLPADREPTLEEVKQQMNQEQKQGAGMRIAAATLIGGLGGNFLGQNDPGKGGMLGASGDKLKKTAIGALMMGGATAASTQAGKVGGDIIMGAAVNAVGGGLIGNISGVGDNVMLVRKCEGGLDCLYGIVAQTIELVEDTSGNKEGEVGFLGGLGTTKKCVKAKGGDKEVFKNCANEDIPYYTLTNTTLNQSSKLEDIARLMRGDFYCYKEGMMVPGDTGCDGEEAYYRMSKATVMKDSEPAVIVDWNGGHKFADFTEWQRGNMATKGIIRYRYADGTIGRSVDDMTPRNFRPVTQAATDGAIVDLNNKARAKSTATGAGVGAALGGVSAYSGAQEDIQNRWVAEVTAYKDSLTKFYCATGKRYLSQYNEPAVIPASQ